MAIQTTLGKNELATEYGLTATHGAVYTTAPGATAGTEPTGGTPAYARKPLTWGAPSNGVITSDPAIFDIPAGTTVVGTGLHDALTDGNYIDGKTEASIEFTAQDTLTVTFTFSQS
jgi:hypothetical protein